MNIWQSKIINLLVIEGYFLHWVGAWGAGFTFSEPPVTGGWFGCGGWYWYTTCLPPPSSFSGINFANKRENRFINIPDLHYNIVHHFI